MAFALIASVSTGAGTTAAIDTTGANLIVVVIAVASINTEFTESKNAFGAYTEAITNSDADGNTVRVFYIFNPTVGSGHTFSNAFDWQAIAVAAYSGAATSPLDQSGGAN